MYTKNYTLIMLRNRINYKSILFLVLSVYLFMHTFQLSAAISLPALFGNGMVLQQNSNVAVWGTSDPGQNVTIKTSWDNSTYSTVADQSGNWKTKVSTPAAGGPYNINFTDSKSNSIQLNSVWIGDVWICSGQSNMTLDVNYDPDYAAGDPNNGEYPQIHYYGSPFTSWTSPTSSTYTTGFSPIPFFFARNLYNHLKIPIGIIRISYGNSNQEAWLSEPNLAGAETSLKALQDIKNGSTAYLYPRTPMLLHDRYLKPLLPFTIKGVCWYQGESNIYYPDDYVILLNNFIKSWRTELEQPDLPFLITQIAGYGNSYGWPRVQESQYKVPLKYNNVYTVMNYDLGDSAQIHPTNKHDIAFRLCRAAQKYVYKEDSVLAQGPVVRNISFNGQKVGISFNNAGKGLYVKNNDLAINNFLVSGNNKVFYPADARLITKDSVELTNAQVTNPKYMRYAFKAFNKNVNLYNSAGLPVVPFRTDSTTNFVSTQSGDWYNPSTWGGVGVPNMDDNVTISTGHTVTSFINSTNAVSVDLCKSLTVNGILQISNLQSAAYTVNVYDRIGCNGSIEIGRAHV